MRNSPPIDRTRGAIFRTAPASSETNTQGGGGSSFTDEVLGSLVCVLSLRHRLRLNRIERAHGRLRIVPDPQPTPPIIEEVVETVIVIEELPEAVEDSVIEIGEVPLDLLFPSTSETVSELGPRETPDSEAPSEVVRRHVADRPFSAGWDVLGQYVAYILDRSSRSLRDYIEAKARERMSRAERRVQAATKERKYSSRSERTRQKRQRVMKLPAYVAQVKLELQREVHELVKGAHWLTFGARDPENAFCMTRAKNHRQVFFLVQRDEAGSGGKVIGVYDSPHFTRMVRQHGRRGYRKLPLRRR